MVRFKNENTAKKEEDRLPFADMEPRYTNLLVSQSNV